MCFYGKKQLVRFVNSVFSSFYVFLHSSFLIFTEENATCNAFIYLILLGTGDDFEILTKLSSDDNIRIQMAEKKYSKGNDSLESLLNLDNEIFLMEDGYWTKFEISRVPPSPQIPHGIRYSLTFHDRNNTRVLGFDNAHIVKAKRRKYGYRKITLDHKHKLGRVSPYEFKSPEKLLEDFWFEVEEIIKKK